MVPLFSTIRNTTIKNYKQQNKYAKEEGADLVWGIFKIYLAKFESGYNQGFIAI